MRKEIFLECIKEYKLHFFSIGNYEFSAFFRNVEVDLENDYDYNFLLTRLKRKFDSHKSIFQTDYNWIIRDLKIKSIIG